jgi:acyl-CoA thioesterase I
LKKRGLPADYSERQISTIEMGMLDTIREKIKMGDPLTIIGFGDSLTEGWMASKGYLDFISEMIRDKYPGSSVTVVNRGIPGDTATGGLRRLRNDVLDHNPDLVFVQFALNDAFLGYSEGQFGQAIQEIIECIANDTSAVIMLLTSVAIQSAIMNEVAERFYNVLIRLAESNSIPIALVHKYWWKKIEEGASFKRLTQADGVHPTVEGYRFMAEAVMELL